jgi:hypothetical protein
MGQMGRDLVGGEIRGLGIRFLKVCKFGDKGFRGGFSFRTTKSESFFFS